MPQLTRDDIQRAVGRRALEAGLAYEADGRVSQLQASADGRLVETQVRGSERRPYRVRVVLGPAGDGTTAVRGTCSCPVGRNCKHVAASLLAALSRAAGPLGPAPSGPPAATEPERHAPRRSLAPVPASGSHDRLPPVRHRMPASRDPGGEPPPAEPHLPSEIAEWLRSLDRAQEDTEAYPPGVRKRLLYVASARPAASGPDRLDVALVGVDVRADGGVSDRAKTYSPYQFLSGQPPRFLRPSDRGILRQLASLGHEGGEAFAGVPRQIIATGRGRWARADGPALRIGEPRPGRFAWRLDDEGGQRLALAADGGHPVVLAGGAWYVEPATGVMGPLDPGVPAPLLRTLLASPALPPETAERVGAEVARRLPGVALPAPERVSPPRRVGGRPVPHLELFGAAAAGGEPMPAARLRFHYEGVPVPALPRLPEATVRHDGLFNRVARDWPAENDAEAALARLGFERLGALDLRPVPVGMGDVLVLDDDGETWIDILLHDVPALRRAGWRVEVAGSFPLRLVEASGDITARISEGSGIDWFDLELGVAVAGERVDLVPALIALIAEGGQAASALANDGTLDEEAPLLLPLADGRLLAIPPDRIRPILAPLLELFAGGLAQDATGLRFPRASAADLAALEAASRGAGVAWTGGEAVRRLGRQLRDAGGIPPVPVPASFAAELRPYQARGVDWLGFLRTAGLGGVLADDMGLGKTVQALAHLAAEQAEGRLDGPALVVCPTSLVPNWRAEAARFAPALRVLTLHGRDRAARFGAIAGHDLVVTTYPLLARDHAVLAAQAWRVVVLDEAQMIKNPGAATSKLARTLRAGQRLCLSGTPLENHLGELWSLFDFLLPGFLGDRQAFARRFRAPIEKRGDEERRAVLARRVAPFLLRRTKAEVAAELPPKTEIAESVEMGEGQRALYEGIRLAMHARVRAAVAERGLARSGIVVLDALLKLRQACCDPRLLPLKAGRAPKARSAKLERLMELLPPMLEDGRRVLLFSQFTSMLALIEAELARRSLPYALLTGGTRDRREPVRRFQAGEVPLFLVSLKAGGVGLNLTAADTVVHYDPWWNPAVEDQATDRAHRIGQDKPVFVHRLVTVGTIEQKMEALKSRKQALVAGILGAGRGSTLALTEADLDDLFAPAEQ